MLLILGPSMNKRSCRNESRQDEAYRILTSGLSLESYKSEIFRLQTELEEDMLISARLNNCIDKRHDPNILPCGYYQQEKCHNTGNHSQSNTNSTIRHHICVFCLNLLNKIQPHSATKCILFKILDHEFKDFQDTRKSTDQEDFPKNNMVQNIKQEQPY